MHDTGCSRLVHWMTQKDGMGREVERGFRMGNTSTPMVDSCQCMAKPIQYCKVKKQNKTKPKNLPLRCLTSLVAQLIKNLACNAGDQGLIPGSGRFPWKREWQRTLVFLPGEFHGQRSLMGLQFMGLQRLGCGCATNTWGRGVV